MDGDDKPAVLMKRPDNYLSIDLTIEDLDHLEQIGLLIQIPRFSGKLEYEISPAIFSYHGHTITVEVSPDKPSNQIPRGYIHFTVMGAEIASICSTPEVPGLVKYVTERFFPVAAYKVTYISEVASAQ